jgi:hypothetical protein
VQRKGLLLCVVLLIMMFIFMASGCGGGSSSNGYVPTPTPVNPEPDPEQTPTFDREDVEEANTIINNIIENTYEAHKSDTLNFDELITLYTSVLKQDERVKSVTTEIGENPFETLITINFTSGYKTAITFVSEEYLELIYRDSDYGVSNLSPKSTIGNASQISSPRSAVARNGTLRAFVGKSQIQFLDNFNVFSRKSGNRIIELLSYVDNDSNWPNVILTDRVTQEMELDDLRNLNGYDYIFITAHGDNSGNFSINSPWMNLPSQLDAKTIEDIYQDRIVTVTFVPIGIIPPLGGIPIGGVFVNGKFQLQSPFDFLNDLNQGSYFVIKPMFFYDYYGTGGLKDSIIFLQSCGLLNGTELSDILLDAGAQCVFGFDDIVVKEYSYNISDSVSGRLLLGDSAAEAFRNSLSLIGQDDSGDGGDGASLVLHTKNAKPENIRLIDGNIIPPPPSSNDVWDGSIDTSWYDSDPTAPNFTISSAAGLAGLTELLATRTAETNNFLGKIIKLSVDIDLKNIAWKPIGAVYAEQNQFEMAPFQGTFDGDNHTISNMTVSGYHYGGGLFAVLQPMTVVQNINLVQVNVSAPSDSQPIGGLAGLSAGSVSNCKVISGSVKGTIGVGGLIGVGYNEGTITNSSASCSVSGSQSAGGFIGRLLISSSGNIGTLSGNTWDKAASGQANAIGYDERVSRPSDNI